MDDFGSTWNFLDVVGWLFQMGWITVVIIKTELSVKKDSFEEWQPGIIHILVNQLHVTSSNHLITLFHLVGIREWHKPNFNINPTQILINHSVVELIWVTVLLCFMLMSNNSKYTVQHIVDLTVYTSPARWLNYTNTPLRVSQALVFPQLSTARPVNMVRKRHYTLIGLRGQYKIRGVSRNKYSTLSIQVSIYWL